MADKKPENDDKAPIIVIKKIKKGGDGHHGGAWKVAYADFVTAMMAFFLLMWLLGATDDQTKHGLSEYFSPNVVSNTRSGAGGMMGGTEISREGSRNQTKEDITNPDKIEVEGRSGEFDPANTEDEATFAAAKEDILDAVEKKIKENPQLAQFKDNLVIDVTHEGLRIQIIDKEGKPMFKAGSATPLPHMVEFVSAITEVIKPLPNKLSVRGHTDATPYSKGNDYTNWELSADRANATRRIMLGAKLKKEKLQDIQGRAATDLFNKTDPTHTSNRRVGIIILWQTLADMETQYQKAKKRRESQRKKKSDRKKREKGVIYFP